MNKAIVVGLALAVGFVEMSAVGSAAPIFNPATGHYYDIAPSSPDGSWQNAENYALTLGGHLVTINDAAEDLWLKQTFGTASNFWIGLNDVAEEGTWVWSSGEPVTYTNWQPLDPNNATPPPGGEDYAALWRLTGGWNDYSHLRPDFNVYGPFDGIAEYTAIPEPGTLILCGLGIAALAGRARRRG